MIEDRIAGALFGYLFGTLISFATSAIAAYLTGSEKVAIFIMIDTVISGTIFGWFKVDFDNWRVNREIRKYHIDR